MAVTAAVGCEGLRSQPARAPKTRLKPKVSQKWTCATAGGIMGFGRSSAVVQTERKSAMASAVSHRATRSMRTSGYKQAA